MFELEATVVSVFSVPRHSGLLRVALCLFSIAVLTGCNSPAAQQSALGDASFQAVQLSDPVDYRIAPGDILEINVYQFDKLSRTAHVDGSGRISMPLIGPVNASGRTALELESDIAGRYGARYLQSPQISVFLKESAGLRVTIDGAVRKPGVYALKGHTTLLHALALAEGLNDVGDSGAVTVVRTVSGERSADRYDLAAIRSGQAQDPQIYGGDTIVVDESMARHGVQMFKAALPGMAQAGLWRVVP